MYTSRGRIAWITRIHLKAANALVNGQLYSIRIDGKQCEFISYYSTLLPGMEFDIMEGPERKIGRGVIIRPMRKILFKNILYVR